MPTAPGWMDYGALGILAAAGVVLVPWLKKQYEAAVRDRKEMFGTLIESQKAFLKSEADMRRTIDRAVDFLEAREGARAKKRTAAKKPVKGK